MIAVCGSCYLHESQKRKRFLQCRSINDQRPILPRRYLMKKLPQNPSTLFAAALGLSAFLALAQIAPAADIAAKPYKILTTTQIPAAGGLDYVTADSVNRRVYVACGNAVSVFDLDTYKLAGTLANASGHGVAVDPENHTGLVSGTNAVFFNTKTLEPIKTIQAPGADVYIFDAPTHH